MLTNVYAAKCLGIDAIKVTVEIDITLGIGVHMVGLADVAVKESLLRTITALQSMGFHIPGKKIVINLAPADMQKRGSGYDLPIAVGIVAASGQGDFPCLEDFMIMGELGLDGAVRPVAGALSIVELAAKEGFRACILPLESAMETIECEGIDVYGVRTLADVIRILGQRDDPSGLLVRNQDIPATGGASVDAGHDYMDFSEIVGQDMAKRGAEIACAGGHNVIMIGPMGAGKTSLAKAMAGILPPMTTEEALTTSKIYSVAGRSHAHRGLIRERPFRAPHYSASLAAIIGGGAGDNIMPGEVSLAQNGILFLDEFCLAPKSVLEALRGPIEDRKVVVSRLRSKVEFPSSFMLVAATNPCPCGYYGEGDRCTCTPGQRAAYLAKLSGPIMDRIDIQLWMHPVDSNMLVHRGKSELSKAVAARVVAARAIQGRRFSGRGIYTNAQMSSRQVEEFCPLTPECSDFMERLISETGLSARAYTRILKLARTIADLDSVASASEIGLQHLSEAASYRFLDRSPR